MKLSLIMAVHDQAATLESAVSSILNQSFGQFEFIIVDDASASDTKQILNRFSQQDKRIKLITNSHQLGLTRSLNKALAQARGQYIARMDSDDLALATRLEKQLEYLSSHSQLALLGTAVYLINSEGNRIGLKRYPSDYQTLKKIILSYCPFVHPTLMIRHSVLRELGGYKPEFTYAQDYELVLRLLAQYPAANLPQPLLEYRVDTPEAISFKHLKLQERLALKARVLALTQYHYPFSQAWRLLKPGLSYLVPSSLKKIIYRRFFWHQNNL
jgi:glycosyltransferase involved in cell wall biosynthesis